MGLAEVSAPSLPWALVTPPAFCAEEPRMAGALTNLTARLPPF